MQQHILETSRAFVFREIITETGDALFEWYRVATCGNKIEVVELLSEEELWERLEYE
jgi:hypothetical protein